MSRESFQSFLFRLELSISIYFLAQPYPYLFYPFWSHIHFPRPHYESTIRQTPETRFLRSPVLIFKFLDQDTHRLFLIEACPGNHLQLAAGNSLFFDYCLLLYIIRFKSYCKLYFDG